MNSNYVSELDLKHLKESSLVLSEEQKLLMFYLGLNFLYNPERSHQILAKEVNELIDVFSLKTQEINTNGEDFYNELNFIFKDLNQTKKVNPVFKNFSQISITNIEEVTFGKLRSSFKEVLLGTKLNDDQKKIFIAYFSHLAISSGQDKKIKNINSLCQAIEIPSSLSLEIYLQIISIHNENFNSLNKLQLTAKCHLYFEIARWLLNENLLFSLEGTSFISNLSEVFNLREELPIKVNDYLSKSFMLSKFWNLRGIPKNEAEIILALAKNVINADGVQDKQETKMLVELLKWVGFDKNSKKLANQPNTMIRIKESNRVYSLLVLIQISLADNEIQKEEFEIIFKLLKEILQSSEVIVSDEDRLCFLEILIQNPGWLTSYQQFFNTLANFIFKGLDNEERLLRVICSTQFIRAYGDLSIYSEVQVDTLCKVLELTYLEKERLEFHFLEINLNIENLKSRKNSILLAKVILLQNLISHILSDESELVENSLKELIKNLGNEISLPKSLTKAYTQLKNWI